MDFAVLDVKLLALFAMVLSASLSSIPSDFEGASSSRFTLSRFDVFDMRCESGDDVRRELGFDSGLLGSRDSSLALFLSLSSTSIWLDRLFVTETDRFVNERTDPASTVSTVLSALSTASSNESCSPPCRRGQHTVKARILGKLVSLSASL